MSAAGLAPVFEGPFGGQLHDRLVAAVLAAQDLLGADADATVAGNPSRLRGLVEAMTACVAQRRDGDPGGAVREQEAALERLRNRFDTRFAALADVQKAIAELRSITSPAAMLGRAPAALCAESRFERVLLSLAASGRMVPESAHFTGDTRGATAVLDALRAEPVRLEHPLIETELLRRRRATIIEDARVHPRVDRRLVELMGWTSYAAAPLVVGSRVIGVVHADRGAGSRLDVLDRDLLWEFTSALAQAYESASLRRTLRHEREQMREFLGWLGARSSELTDAPVRLRDRPAPPSPPLSVAETALSVPGRDDRVVFSGLLTRRELDVLRLLADGKSNKAIAQALVISNGTVKFHVNSILRKLRVANRAEAVSRYLRLLGMRSP